MSWLQGLAEVNEQDWRPVGTPAFFAATLGIALVAFLANTGQRWVFLLDMADARAQVLPLVGSGEHDWTEIFSRWGVLGRDTGIAGFVTLLGWLGVLIAWGWLARRWWLDRELGQH